LKEIGDCIRPISVVILHDVNFFQTNPVFAHHFLLFLGLCQAVFLPAKNLQTLVGEYTSPNDLQKMEMVNKNWIDLEKVYIIKDPFMWKNRWVETYLITRFVRRNDTLERELKPNGEIYLYEPLVAFFFATHDKN
jgi:hypothetical protein